MPIILFIILLKSLKEPSIFKEGPLSVQVNFCLMVCFKIKQSGRIVVYFDDFHLAFESVSKCVLYLSGLCHQFCKFFSFLQTFCSKPSLGFCFGRLVRASLMSKEILLFWYSFPKRGKSVSLVLGSVICDYSI